MKKPEGPRQRCLILTTHNFVPELRALGLVPHNVSLFDRNPALGCAAGNVSFLTANFWTNAVAARRLGCDYRFVRCRPSTGPSLRLRVHWCKVAALYQLMTHRAWSHLREVLLIDADVRLGQAVWSLDRVMETLGRTPLRALSYSQGNGTAIVQKRASVANASVITSPGYACGLGSVIGGVRTGFETPNVHCSCMMLWRVDSLARWLAEQWLRSSSAFEYDQLGFNDVARRMGQGRTVAVPSRTLFADSNHGDDHRRPEVVRKASAATNQEHRQCTGLVDGNDVSLRGALPLGSEGYVARHRQKGCVPTDALRPHNDDEMALLHELLERPLAMMNELDYERPFAQVLPRSRGTRKVAYPRVHVDH